MMARAGIDTDAVVSAAATLADAEGLDAVTLAQLANDLGVRAPSLYAHVAGLPDLLRRLAIRGAEELAAQLQTAAAGRARRDALGAIAQAYRAYAQAHPGTYMAAQRAYPGDEGVEEVGGRVVAVVLAVLRGYGLGGEEAVHATRTVRAALHGFAALELGGGFGLPLSVEDSYTRLVDTLDRGLALTTEHASHSRS